jgi:hypothetical protein
VSYWPSEPSGDIPLLPERRISCHCGSSFPTWEAFDTHTDEAADGLRHSPRMTHRLSAADRTYLARMLRELRD